MNGKKLSKHYVVFSALFVLTFGCQQISEETKSMSNLVKEECTVTFYPNAPADCPEAEWLTEITQTYTAGSEVYAPDDLFSLEGYRLIRWADKPSSYYDSYYYYDVGEYFYIHENMNLYAIWEIVAPQKALIIEDGVVTGFKSESGITEVVIPDGVTAIKDGVFKNCNGVTSVTIPDSVTSIGDYAFNGCSGLISVIIPDSVTSIGNYAFNGCNNLETVYWNAKACTSAGSSRYPVFSNCSKLVAVVVGDNVTSIPLYAFSDCKNLTSITIPDSVTSIGGYAFNGCTGLTSITIPDGVTSIGGYAFNGCNNLETAYWNAKACTSNSGSVGGEIFSGYSGLITVVIGGNVTSIPLHEFYNCTGLVVDSDNLNYSSQDGILYSKDKTELIYVPKAISRGVTIPESVTSIRDAAFSGCKGVTSITIPDSVLRIGDRAFSGCTGLTSITIPDGVTGIGDNTFTSCTGLTSVTISDSVTSIGENAFRGCTNLRNITIPDSVRYIGYNVFKGCSGLRSVEIGNGITSIKSGMLSDCSNLTNITLPFIGESKKGTDNTHFGYIFGASTYLKNGDYIPKSLKYVTITSGDSIGDYAFYGCKNITNITIPASVTRIGNSAFGYAGSRTGFSCITYTGELKDWCAIKGLQSLMGYTASNKTLTIGEKKITSDLVIPDGVTRIEDYAFYHYFSGLTSITLPDSLEYIGAWSFCKCTGVTSITFKGTQDQWKTMTRGSWWDNKAGNGNGFLKVICIDGTLVKSNIVN